MIYTSNNSCYCCIRIYDGNKNTATEKQTT